MRVRLRFFASLRERFGHAEAERDVVDGVTVGDLWTGLCAERPQLAAVAAALSFAVNREYVGREHRLSDGDELAFIPPVSGG